MPLSVSCDSSPGPAALGAELTPLNLFGFDRRVSVRSVQDYHGCCSLLIVVDTEKEFVDSKRPHPCSKYNQTLLLTRNPSVKTCMPQVVVWCSANGQKDVHLVIVDGFLLTHHIAVDLTQERRHVVAPSRTARRFPVAHDSYVTVARTLRRSDYWRWNAHDTAVSTSSCVLCACENVCALCTDQCSAVEQPLRAHTSDDVISVKTRALVVIYLLLC